MGGGTQLSESTVGVWEGCEATTLGTPVQTRGGNGQHSFWVEDKDWHVGARTHFGISYLYRVVKKKRGKKVRVVIVTRKRVSR